MSAPYFVPVGENGQELLDRGSLLFPCAIYQRDIREYVDGEITPHWHREMEVFVLESGQARLRLPEAEYDMEAGEGYFVNSNVLHGIENLGTGKCSYRSMVFDPGIVAGAPGSAFDALYVRPFAEQGRPAFFLGEESSFVLEQFQAAFKACQDQKDGYEFQARQALSQILLFLKERSKESKPSLSKCRDQRLKTMISWLDAHYREPVTIGQLAFSVGLCAREYKAVNLERLALHFSGFFCILLKKTCID